ncbi:MAG: DUF72 domain-containing protein [Candidatus Caldatribacteriaceae bacterium]
MVKRCWVGTSGWTYPHWKGVFYPVDLNQKHWLSFYAQFFDTVEINASFYRLPSFATFSRWQKNVLTSFLFAVKASRYITHVKKLKDVEEPLERFYHAVTGLGNSCGPLLFQFSPQTRYDRERLATFVERLDPRFRYVFEFRHLSFFCTEVYELFQTKDIALCFADTPLFPYKEVLTASFVYLRLHGSSSLYTHYYEEKELWSWAEKIDRFRKEREVFCYFDNDYQGFAVQNALRLKEILGLTY